MKCFAKSAGVFYFIPALLLISAVSAHAADEPSLEQVIAGKHRSPANAARDPYRHPKATLEFLGVRPDMTVLETLPGAGWYTEILAPYLRGKGGLIVATMLLPDDAPAYFRDRQAAYYGKMDADPENYGRVQRTFFKKTDYLEDLQDNSVDMVLDSRNLHNYIRFGGAEEVFGAYYRVLKPGGVLGLIDHRAPAGADVKRFADQGYVPEAFAVTLAEGAGFKFAAKSEINANPKDDRNHPKGVWTLPPTYRLGDVDREKYSAIGESDRMTLKFIKPAD